MVVSLNPDIERLIKERAERSGQPADQIVNDALRRQFLPRVIEDLPPPRDEWERRLRSIGVATGVSLTDEQVSRECIYED